MIPIDCGNNVHKAFFVFRVNYDLSFEAHSKQIPFNDRLQTDLFVQEAHE